MRQNAQARADNIELIISRYASQSNIEKNSRCGQMLGEIVIVSKFSKYNNCKR